ncbi:hypothetical protein HPP92_003502 [Vanilla planifolia]|uniref:Uncharacterized protein n=1 Tax=Vanilla planifolia TaxID=51239 RepID=A0A835SAH9_VANPL|nr:hypothetical protein HPP92_003895 [Vanilla planifolia]KAG0503430.1 hypothetical protein HPP92_003502 [Vanilla planifolia]
MEGGEKSHPQRSGVGVGVGGGEFFICFRIRPPSSSSTVASASTAMRVRHSKCIMSPGRGRVPSSVPEISSSLSLRFRRNGSLKGAQSPMFPAGVQNTGRKKGGAMETAEPSSPKVTCIGQVRVRSKKKGKFNSKSPVMGSTANRVDGGRGCFPERKQGMFLRICQAFRSLGLALNCFVPCVGRSKCCSLSRKAGEGKRCRKKIMARPESSTARGDEIAKWLPSCDDGQNVVGEEREKVEMEMGFLLQEREEKLEMEVEEIRKRRENREMAMVGVKEEDGEGQEAGRASVCIPPKNALLLMRCRSDPVRMAAMANRFWGSHKEKERREEEAVEEEEKMEKLDDSQRMEEDNQFTVAVMKRAEREEANQTKDEGDEQNLQQPNQHEPEVEDEVGIAGKDLSCGSPSIGESSSSPKEVQKEEAEGTHLPEKQESNKMARKKSHTFPSKKGGKEIRCSRPKDGLRKGSKEKDARRHSFSSERETIKQSFSSEKEAKKSELLR